MKIISRFALGLIVCGWMGMLPRAARADDAPGLKSGDYVAVIGDSITEQRQYSMYIEDYLLMCKPADNLSQTQFGWGGETAPGFAARMNNDMVPFGATVATTCYGMNDGGYRAMTPDTAKQYTNGQQSIIDQLKKANVRMIVIGSPGAVDSDSFKRDTKAQVYNETLAALGEIDKKMAADQGLVYADVHGPMMDVMAKMKAKYGNTYQLCGGDGVHPDHNGHLVMAYAFLKALGCKGDIGTITVDLAAGSAQGSDGQKIVSVNNGTVTVESSRYPFCFQGDPAKTNATTGVLEFLPFNDDLNRFMLVVNNAPGDKMKVTWGKTSKEYSAADLKKGINLAAEFLDNPFSAPFAAVEQKIAHQQERETDLVKTRIHNLPGLIEWLPDQKDDILKIRDDLVKADAPLRDASAAAVKPVTHAIVIEVEK